MSAAIAKALHAVMEECSYVQKSKRNTFHNYSYAGEGDLLDKLRPAMVKHGLMLLPSARRVSDADIHGNVTVEVEYTLAHKDGEVWPEKLVAVGCGNDKAKNGSIGDKGVYKALTGANKYLLFKLFQIETGDDPEASDAAAAAKEPPQQPKQQLRPAQEPQSAQTSLKAPPLAAKADAPVNGTATTSGPSDLGLMIRVPTGKDGNPNWDSWLKSIGYAIDECSSLTEVNALEHDNQPPANNLRHQSATLADRLAKRFEDRRNYFRGSAP